MSEGAERRRELVTLGAACIDVIVEGAGPALVLLPSSLRDSEDFDGLAGLLATEGFQVLRPQPRGMGRSSEPPEGMTLETLAADVAGVIAALAAGPAVVVGHAYGHWVARLADLRHPQQVRGVVLLAAGARQFPPGLAEALAIASDPQQPEEDRLAALRHCMFAPGHEPHEWLEGWHPEWRAAYRHASQHPPRDEWFASVRSPVLDLQGAQDEWRPPATRRELADLAPDRVTVQVIARAGHAMVPEQPRAVAQAICGWVRRLDNPPDAQAQGH